MESEVQSYLTEFATLREQIREAIQGLPDEAVNWRPLPEGTNSICALMFHLMGSDNYWIRQVIRGQTIQRDREAEFHTSGRLSELLPRWEKAGRETEEDLRGLSSAQLAETRNTPGRPDRGLVTVRGCILHQISHYATHLGHIQLTRQLWEKRLP